MQSLGHREYHMIHHNLINMLQARGVVLRNLDTGEIESDLSGLRIPDAVFAQMNIGDEMNLKDSGSYRIWDPRLERPVYIIILSPNAIINKGNLPGLIRIAFTYFGEKIPDDFTPRTFHLIIVGQLRKSRVGLKQFGFEIWDAQSLIYNPSQHIYVPKHVLLSPEEAQEVIARYSKIALPKILETDIQPRWLGAKPDQIIRIERPTEMAYRLVIPDYNSRGS